MHRYICKSIATIITVGIAFQCAYAAQLAETYAGTGMPGSRDDANVQATFNQPYGITGSGTGGLIVVDTLNSLVRKVEDGKVTTIAGFTDKKDSFGLPRGGYSDGDAMSARFDRPRDAAVDSSGNIYVADTENHSIRKISGGRVFSFAGNGTAGYADGPGPNAKFNMPSGIAVDKDGYIYVADTMNNVIRKISPEGEVSTFAGTYSHSGSYKDGAALESGFNEPSDIAFDNNGTIYILDTGNQSVRKIYRGFVFTVAGLQDQIDRETGYIKGGYADGGVNAARFNFPKGLCISDRGIIYIADTWNNCIRGILPGGRVITVAGPSIGGKTQGIPVQAVFNFPSHVLFYNKTLYVSDTWNNNIKSLSIDEQELLKLPERNDILRGINFEPVSDSVQVWVDKVKLNFPDIQPYEADGKTYVPLRFICETWGAEVKWDESSNQIEITKSGFHRTLQYGIDPVTEKDGRAMIHLRNLAESMGFYVDWVQEYSAAVISSEK